MRACSAGRVSLLGVLCLLAGGATWASRGADTLMEGAQFVRDFTEQAAGYYEQRLEALKAERERLTALREAGGTEADRAWLSAEIGKLDQRIDEVTEKKLKAAGEETAWQVFDALAKTHETINEIEDALGQTDTWHRQIVWLDQAAGYELAQAREQIEQASEILEYAGMIQALAAPLREADRAAPNPRIKDMLACLYVLFRAFEEFGDKVPALEVFVKRYGEVGKALTAAAGRLDVRLQNRSQGLLIDGYPDDGRVAAFDAQFPQWAADRDMRAIERLPGVRDAYVWPDGGVLIWEPTADRWHYRPDVTPQDLRRRYAFFATYGNPNPTPEQVLGAHPRRLLGLWIVALPRIVAPGGEVSFSVWAERLEGGAPAIDVAVKSEALHIFSRGAGTFSQRVVELEEWAQWTAPEVSNAGFRLTATLPEGETAYRLVGPASIDVATGLDTEMRLEAEPALVEPRGDGHVNFEVVYEDGARVGKKGIISAVGSAGLELEEPYYLGEGESRGAVTFHAPAEPGEYTVEVRFSGYIDAGRFFSDCAMPCSAEAVITVQGDPRPPLPDEGNDTPPDEGPPPTPAGMEDVEYFEIAPHYLVHIIETATMYGPVEKDAWILHPKKPEPDGSLLTADGTGGWFSNKTDRHQGPFTNSHQVCAAMRGLGLQIVTWHDDFFRCPPRQP